MQAGIMKTIYSVFFLAIPAIAHASAPRTPYTDTQNFFLPPGEIMCTQPGPLVLVLKGSKRDLGCFGMVIKPMIVGVMDVNMSTGLSYVCRIEGMEGETRFQPYWYSCGYAFTKTLVNEWGVFPGVKTLQDYARAMTFEKFKKVPAPMFGCLIDDSARHC
jgi:hypothetical protein